MRLSPLPAGLIPLVSAAAVAALAAVPAPVALAGL